MRATATARADDLASRRDLAVVIGHGAAGAVTETARWAGGAAARATGRSHARISAALRDAQTRARKSRTDAGILGWLLLAVVRVAWVLLSAAGFGLIGAARGTRRGMTGARTAAVRGWDEGVDRGITRVTGGPAPAPAPAVTRTRTTAPAPSVTRTRTPAPAPSVTRTRTPAPPAPAPPAPTPPAGGPMTGTTPTPDAELSSLESTRAFLDGLLGGFDRTRDAVTTGVDHLASVLPDDAVIGAMATGVEYLGSAAESFAAARGALAKHEAIAEAAEGVKMADAAFYERR